MLRKQLEIPREAALEFVKAMRAYFKAKGTLDGDHIAADAAWLLKHHLPKGTKLRITEVKELFLQMKDHA